MFFFFSNYFSVAAANDAQRRLDGEEEASIDSLIPENSRIARQRAAKRNRRGAEHEPEADALSKINE